MKVVKGIFIQSKMLDAKEMGFFKAEYEKLLNEGFQLDSAVANNAYFIYTFVKDVSNVYPENKVKIEGQINKEAFFKS